MPLRIRWELANAQDGIGHLHRSWFPYVEKARYAKVPIVLREA